MIRGIRGAITVKSNTKEEIIEATKKVLQEMISENSFHVNDIASIIFSVTADLNAAFPAEAARQLGWKTTPLLCTKEIPVPKSLAKCIRVLMHFNTEKKQYQVTPVYLEGAKVLREDKL
ncbi:MAG: chorismate mutase [Candidatus Saganbacteria bacterium]|nr:chorismate mutase [Candidatus Saganbacteria bacterium]